MKYVPAFSERAILSIAAAVFVNSFVTATAQVQSGQVLIQAVQGSATYSTGAGWQPLTEKTILSGGAAIKTDADAHVDLILQYNGTVLRLMPNSLLSFDKLNKDKAGEETITETSLNLKAGSILGSQRKLATPSSFEVHIPGGVAMIKGTEYLVRADGAVTVLSGTVQVIYDKPHNGGSIKVDVPAGFSFNPATGKVVRTTAAFLKDIIADINTVRENAKVFKTGGATVVVKPERVVSPTKGNNGVGNGQDPQPPGNPPVNDGPGTGPGNPGNRQHAKGPAEPHHPTPRWSGY
jgi:FecR-like protein